MQTQNIKTFPKYIILLSMLYLVAFIFPVILAYRMVQLGPLLEAGGTIFFPASYFFADIIAEVYGYKISKKLLWSAIFCQFLITILIFTVLHLPQPHFWHDEKSFDIVLGHVIRYAIASSIGNFAGEFLNIYIISKLKIFFKGKLFWLRSFIASCVGELVLTAIVFTITFIGITSLFHMLELTLFAFVFKVIFAAIAALIGNFIVKFLKLSEGIDIYDLGINYNPFKSE